MRRLREATLSAGLWVAVVCFHSGSCINGLGLLEGRRGKVWLGESEPFMIIISIRERKGPGL